MTLQLSAADLRRQAGVAPLTDGDLELVLRLRDGVGLSLVEGWIKTLVGPNDHVRVDLDMCFTQL